MVIDFKILLGNKITTNDIIINEKNTYPKSLIRQMACEDFQEYDLVEFFRNQVHFNIIGVHFTRLFDYEIKDVKNYGLHSDDTVDYERKINRMPKEFQCYKHDLIKYISNQRNKRSNGRIYFDIGRIEITIDNSVFLENWGGETLYSYYTNPENNRQDLENLKGKLKKNTCPCMVIIRMCANQFFDEYPDNKSIVNYCKSNNIMNYEGEHCSDGKFIKVVDVIPLKK